MRLNIFLIITLGFLFRLFVSFWNGYFGPSLGAELDALSFHSEAVSLLGEPMFSNLRTGWIYASFLSCFYSLTIPSLFLGSLLSVIFWLFSALVLYKITELFMMTKTQSFWVLTIFSLMPSSILFTSITLREAYEILFINISLYSFFKIYLTNKFRYYVLAMFCIFLSSKLHIALLIPTCSLLFFAILLRLSKKATFNLAIFIIFLFILFAILFSVESLEEYYFNLHQAVSDFRFRATTIEARANFISQSELDRSFNINNIPNYFLLYMTQPFPWHLNLFLDFGVMIENLIRLLLLFSSFISLFKLQGDRKKIIFVLLTTYLLTEAIWAIGSLNYGTAIRHHLVSLGLLSIISLSYIKNKSTINRIA